MGSRRIGLKPALVEREVHNARQGDQIAFDRGVRRAIDTLASPDNVGDQAGIYLVEMPATEEGRQLRERACVAHARRSRHLVWHPSGPRLENLSEAVAPVAMLRR
jgi:hypothetical protein